MVVLLIGAGIGWAVTLGGAEWQEGIAVAVVWLLLLGGVSTFVWLSGPMLTVKFMRAGEKEPKSLVPGLVGRIVVGLVAIIALWVGGRRLLGI